MKIGEIAKVLEKTVQTKLPVLLVGPPGVGKSEIVEQAAKALDYDLIVSHPVVSDPTDARGLPWPNGDSARFLPFGELKQAMEATKPTIWFLDDLGQAPPAVQAAFMQLLLSRRVNEHKLSDEVVFVAATNRREDRAGVSGILEPVKSRFATILHVDVNLDDWINWAIRQDVDPMIIAYLRFRPDNLHVFKPTTDMVNQPCPRTWAFVDKLLKAGIEKKEVLAGAIGEGVASEFVSFRSLYHKVPDVDSLLRGAHTFDASIYKLDELYAILTMVAARAKDAQLPAVAKLAERLTEQERVEMAMMLMNDLFKRRGTQLLKVKEVKQLLTDSKLGHMLKEAVTG